MSNHGPIVTTQTIAQNEALETVMGRMREREISIPPYQRDSDEWDSVKKSLFIESILNRLTVPAFYLAPAENQPDLAEVVDGQQRLTTLSAFFLDEFKLLPHDRCPYFGEYSVHYADKLYSQLGVTWQAAFRRYNLTMVSLPQEMTLDLRLEIFRRINDGGTPLSAQDIRLSYYSESPAVRLIQLAGIYDPKRAGSERMIEGCEDMFRWPWDEYKAESVLWKSWWDNTKTATGQTASEMFTWFLLSTEHSTVNDILSNKAHLSNNLNHLFRNRTDEVLDVFCAQLRYEDRLGETQPRLLPTSDALRRVHFPNFARWFGALRNQCSAQVSVNKYRSVAMLLPGLVNVFGQDPSKLTDSQWGWIGKFLSRTRATATELGVDFPEAKGRWNGSRGQSAQLDAFNAVARAISKK